MCTIGAKILKAGHEYLLFKNRDFARTHFDDAIWGDDDVFGVMGLASWDATEGETFSGFAFAFNDTLTCADAFVRHSADEDNFDKLVQAVVYNCSTIDEALSCVQQQVQDRRYGWCNLVVANAYETAAIEVRDGRVDFERNPVAVVRTNHHICLAEASDTPGSITSHDRYQVAQTGIAQVSSVDDLLKLLSSHFAERAHGLCNHGKLNTVYSYVLHWHDGTTTLYVHQGNPCDDKPYAKVAVNLDGDTFLGSYPSERDTLF